MSKLSTVVCIICFGVWPDLRYLSLVISLSDRWFLLIAVDSNLVCGHPERQYITEVQAMEHTLTNRDLSFDQRFGEQPRNVVLAKAKQTTRNTADRSLTCRAGWSRTSTFSAGTCPPLPQQWNITNFTTTTWHTRLSLSHWNCKHKRLQCMQGIVSTWYILNNFSSRKNCKSQFGISSSHLENSTWC